MNIIRWFSCHLIILIIVISAALGWFYRQELANDFARLTNTNAVQARQDVSANMAKPSRPVSPEDISRTTPISEDVSSEAAQIQPGDAWSSEAAMPAAIQPGSEEPLPPATATVPGQDQVSEYSGDSGNAVPGIAPEFPDDSDSLLEQAQPVMPPLATESDADSVFPPDDYDPELGKSIERSSSDGAMRSEREQEGFRDDSAPASNMFPQQNTHNDYAASDTRIPVSGQVMRPASQSSDAFQAQLETARRLQWGGEIDKARQEYENLMLAQPDNPEVASELGNLLMQQNRIQEASRVYDSAIVNFRRLQRDNEAIGLIRFISRYNPTLADTLYNKYWQ